MTKRSIRLTIVNLDIFVPSIFVVVVDGSYKN